MLKYYLFIKLLLIFNNKEPTKDYSYTNRRSRKKKHISDNT